MTPSEHEVVRGWADGIAARIRPGDGESVLWIHGYTMDSSVWSDLWRLLPGGRQIGIDLPWHGRSDPLRTGEDLAALGRLLGRAALADGVHHVVGLSFGTIVALQVAIEHPDAFRTLVLGAPALAGGPQDEAAAERYVELIRMRREGAAGARLAAAWMRSPPDIFKGAEAHPDLYARLAEVIGRHRWDELADGAMLRLTQPTQTAESLHRLRASTHVVVGDHELPPFRRCAELIVAAVPGAEQIELADAGHLCLLERPRESARAIAAALAA